MKTILLRKALLPLVMALAAVVIVGGVALRSVCAQTPPLTAAARNANAAPLGAIAVSLKRECSGSCFSIELGTAARELRNMGSKDQADQLRDWAVYGTLAHLGVNKDAVGQATMHMAPVRLSYLESAYRFDYGRGRRVLYGNKVAFFYDHDDPDPKATLGRLADRVRMETGDQLDVPLVFSIEPDLAWGRILVRQEPEIPAKDLFGSAYGYVESDVQTVADLDAWLKQVDDVTFASPVGTKLRLGGRRGFVKRTMNITVEDVAAIWKAEKKLTDDYITVIENGFVERAKRDFTGLPEDAQLREIAHERILKDWSKARPPAPGFSLDPIWNPLGLAEALDQVAEDPCSVLPLAAEIFRKNPEQDVTATPYAVRVSKALAAHGSLATRPALADACRGARARLEPAFRRMAADVRTALKVRDPKLRAAAVDTAMLPLLRLVESDSSMEIDHLVANVGRFIDASYHMQCARYDGPLAGTNVGMTLFYADVLAKLWESVDYHAAAPGMSVPGFRSAPRQNVPATFVDDLKTKRATRIWFAPNRLSLALVAAQNGASSKLFFEHIATRIFAAGSDPNNPGKEEEEPAEDARRTIGWWNRHYGDVADYEPRYHAQNQIIKWSLITAWAKETLGFLQQQPVDHKLTFDVWLAREGARLRYQHQVPLRPRGDWATTGTECMDLLMSYPFPSYGDIRQIEGGVSLGGNVAIREANVLNTSRPLWQRVTIPPSVSDTAESILTKKAPVYDQGKVKIATATLRGEAVESGASTLTTSVQIAPKKQVAISLGTERGPIGTLEAEPREGAVQLAWTRGLRGDAIDAAEKSVAGKPVEAKRARVEFEQKNSNYVYTNDGVLEITRSWRSEPTPKDALARADSKGFASVVKVKKAPELNKLIDDSKWQRLSFSRNGDRLLSRKFGTSDPPEGIKLELENVPGFTGTLEVHVDDRGQFWIPRPRDDVGRAVWRDIDVRSGLNAEGLASVRRAAKGADARIDYRSLVEERDKTVGTALALTGRGDLAGGRSILKTIAADAEKRLSLARSAIVDADAALRVGDARKAQDLYQLATDTGMAPPDIVLRQALGDIQGRNPASGLQILTQARQLPDDITHLIHQAPGLEDVSMVIRARARPANDILGESPNLLGLSVREGEVVSTLKLSADLPGTRLTPAEVMKFAKAAGDEFYIDDGFSMNRQDFEASFDGSVAEFARMPHTSWREASTTDRYFLPSRIDSKQGSYWRATAGAPLGSESTSAAHSSHKVRVLFIRNCDTDHDGVVSETEREAC